MNESDIWLKLIHDLGAATSAKLFENPPIPIKYWSQEITLRRRFYNFLLEYIEILSEKYNYHCGEKFNYKIKATKSSNSTIDIVSTCINHTFAERTYTSVDKAKYEVDAFLINLGFRDIGGYFFLIYPSHLHEFFTKVSKETSIKMSEDGEAI